MKRIVFIIDTKQDFYLSLSFLFLLKESVVKEDKKTVALITSEANATEFEPYFDLFDHIALIEKCSISRNFFAVHNSVKHFVENIKRLSLGDNDVVIAFSFREFFMNVLIRSLKPKPRLICVRKCDYEVDAQCTARRFFTSIYPNFLNALYGYSLMQYRWHPETERMFTYFFVKNPYDFEFCLNSIQSLKNDGKQIPYPFPILRDHAKELGTTSGEPSIIVLGELYPFFEGMGVAGLSRMLNQVLDFIRHEYPTYKLIFKPREKNMKLDLNLDGFTVAFQDVSLEFLLLRNLSIEKVISFKSSGSFIASLYGCDGYLLYPMLELPKGIRESFDAYFSAHRKSVNFVHELEDLRKTQINNFNNAASNVRQMSRKFLDALL
jgi:hypothetical protein